MKAPVEQQFLDTLNELVGHVPPTADPELCHFLQLKSYEKARLFLD